MRGERQLEPGNNNHFEVGRSRTKEMEKKKMKKKTFVTAFVIAVMFILCAFPALAATSYNPSAALSYARNHWNDGVGECAEFVRKCLNAGDCPVTSNGCSSMVKELKGSKFSGYGSIVELKIQDNGYISLAQNKGKLSAGDPVFYYCGEETDGCPYVHVVLFSGDVDSDGDIKAYAHNNAKNNESIGYKWCGYCSAHIKKAYAFHFNTGASSSSASNSKTAKTVTIKTDGYYPYYNKASGKCVNIYCSGDYDFCDVTLWEYDNTPGVVYKATKVGNGYTLSPKCAPKRCINLNGYSASDNADCDIYSKTNSTTQVLIPKAVEGGVILCIQDDENIVLTAEGTKNGSDIRFRTYEPGNKRQIWTSDAFVIK